MKKVLLVMLVGLLLITSALAAYPSSIETTTDLQLFLDGGLSETNAGEACLNVIGLPEKQLELIGDKIQFGTTNLTPARVTTYFTKFYHNPNLRCNEIRYIGHGYHVERADGSTDFYRAWRLGPSSNRFRTLWDYDIGAVFSSSTDQGLVYPVDAVMPAYCGDESVDGAEECDEGSDNGVVPVPGYGETIGYCTADCMSASVQGPYCGDGTLQEPFEECDDGNNDNGDGCDSGCFSEYPSPSCPPGFSFEPFTCGCFPE